MILWMSTISEIEAAIELLPQPQVEELAAWIEKFRTRRSTSAPIDRWLASATKPGITTAEIMSLTRSDE